MTTRIEKVAFQQMLKRSAIPTLGLILGLSGLFAAVPACHASAGDSAAAASQVRPDLRAPGSSESAYREHASLALFSLGSLAVGGAFYGIHASLGRSGSGSVSGNGTRMETAVGAAGLTALAAGAAYLYYSIRGEGAAEIPSVGVDAEGGVSASITLPLSALTD